MVLSCHDFFICFYLLLCLLLKLMICKCYWSNGESLLCERTFLCVSDAQHQVAAPSYAHHALPQLLTRPQFFIAKPSDISGTLSHPPGVVPLQLPTAMVSTASTLKSNDLEQRELIRNSEFRYLRVSCFILFVNCSCGNLGIE